MKYAWCLILAALVAGACQAVGEEDLVTQPTATGDPAQAAEALRQQVEVSRQALDYEAAADGLTALLELNPSDAALRYELGLLLAAIRPEAALAHLEQAAELDPSRRTPAQAIIDSIRGARLSDDESYRLVQAGRALASQDEWALAEEGFRRATQANPGFADAWAFYGEALQHHQPADGVSAQAALEQAIKIDPASLAGNTLLALYWQRQGDPSRALQILESAARLHPDNPALLVELGKARAITGDMQGGLLAHQQAAALTPTDPTYYRLLAQFSLSQEAMLKEIALPAARQAAALDPNSADSQATLGQVLLMLGDLDSAQRCLRRALEFDALHAPALTQLGLLFALQGNLEQARSYWERAVQVAPGSAAADQAKRLKENYSP